VGLVSDTRTQSVLRWIFRDRQTGRTVIAQRPNIPLLTWLVATAVSWFLHGPAHTVISGLGTIALVIWACDEILCGVNPWRRTLGAVVLVVVLVTWIGSA
jgi:hypothetical protein